MAPRSWLVLSLAFVAACEARHDVGAVRFTQALSNDVDVLFVVDNADRMSDAVPTVAKAVAAFADVVASSVASYHIGIITSEAPGPVSLKCRPGQAGAFVTNPQCPSSSSSFLSAEGGQPSFTGTLDDALTCVFPTTPGCSLQQPFAAVRAALDPTAGAAPPGFLRAGAELVVVFVAGQDDCSLSPGSNLLSAPDGGADAGAVGGSDLLYGCAQLGVMCGYQPLPATPPASPVSLSMCESSEDPRLLTVADTAQFLEELKSDAKQVFVVIVGGPAAPFTIGGMNVAVGSAIAPSCQGNAVAALPPARLQSLADKLTAHGLSTSLCGTELASQLANAAATVLSRSKCLEGVPRFSASTGDASADAGSGPGIPLCDVTLESTTDAGVATSQLLPSCVTAAPPCYQVVPNLADCPASGWQIDLVSGQAPLPSGLMNVDCLGIPSP